MSSPRPLVIFIEGIPGSGKSTFAQRLAFHLQQCGHKARWHHEHDRNHPVIPVGTVNEGDLGDGSRRLASWQRFISRARRDNEIVVLESALFQKQLNGFVKDKREGDLPKFFTSLFRIIHRANPILIHLRQPSIQRHMEWMIARRGQGALRHFAGVRSTAFGAKSRRSDISLVSFYYSRVQRLSVHYANSFPGLVIPLRDARRDWTRAFGAVCHPLGLPDYHPLAMPAGLAARLAGTYKRDDGMELLVLDGDGGRLRFRNDGVLELVDRERLHFFVDNRPDEVRFETSSNGPPKLRVGSWSMSGSGGYARTLPDRFTTERGFNRIAPPTRPQ